MTKAQKKFLSVTLPKFILREQGRGFGMSRWRRTLYKPGEDACWDCLERPAPTCGTIACIGGSAELLLKHRGDDHDLISKLGLSDEEGEGLFYRWRSLHASGCHWPKRFARCFAIAATPLKKARVAASLLKLVAKTEGKCLHHGWKP
jgi:hypothetical protein